MRYLCIHGHFYQPPRENPWLEAIEQQDSARPFHDWNERITVECYAPNSAARILDESHRIARIVNNYASISYNFGPTLLSWLEVKSPETYRRIVDADRASAERFSGHGSAMAQCYNHMIMPLANSRDKETQVIWGIRDFQRRFGRDPEGMWLPETAVDLGTLDLMARQGIRFTILAPSQAKAVNGEDISGGRIDPSRPYNVALPEDRSIQVFFYDGPISRAVAFEGLLNNGEQFARRLLDSFSEDREGPQLGHIATDGETYGHHHRFGEMALAYALDYLESSGLARITNYAEYAEMHPATCQVEILENTAWSCVHGVGRWSGNCGCNSGGFPEWNQEWRAPLRAALDWLRDELAVRFERTASQYLKDPWAARNAYIDVILDHSAESREQFAANHFRRKSLPRGDRTLVWKLLELQRHAMLMYTSCGWFFDELSGIETVQVIQYAARAVQLAGEVFGDSLEQGFVERLAAARSNVPEHRDGANIYEKMAKPAAVDLVKLGAHYAISSLFEQYPDRTQIYCYRVESKDHRSRKSGKIRLATGRARFTSDITGESDLLIYGALHLGDHHAHGAVARFSNEESYRELSKDLRDAVGASDLAGVIRRMDEGFGGRTYSLKDLFRDEQRRVMNEILKPSVGAAESSARQLYEQQGNLLRFLSECHIPAPKTMRMSAEITLNAALRQAVESADLKRAELEGLLEELRIAGAPLDMEMLGPIVRRVLVKAAEPFFETPSDLRRLKSLREAASAARFALFPDAAWTIQNRCYELLTTVYPEMQAKGEAAWLAEFDQLAELLQLRPGSPPAPASDQSQ